MYVYVLLCVYGTTTCMHVCSIEACMYSMYVGTFNLCTIYIYSLSKYACTISCMHTHVWIYPQYVHYSTCTE